MRNDRRLPEDPVYWDVLAARSIDAAFALPAAGAASPETHARDNGAFDAWWRGMADAAFVLAASAVLAVFGGALLLEQLPPRATSETHALAAPPHARAQPDFFASALAPRDPLLATLANARAEPAAFDLLRLIALREETR
jgi:hypothetical protein